jgi:hypothetical protein
MPVRATMRSTMVAKIVTAARPKSDELLGATELAADALESADTVVIPKVEG